MNKPINDIVVELLSGSRKHREEFVTAYQLYLKYEGDLARASEEDNKIFVAIPWNTRIDALSFYRSSHPEVNPKEVEGIDLRDNF